MQTIKYGKFVFLLVFLLVQTGFSITYTVNQGGGGNFTSIQDAIDNAAPGDEILITDVAVYEEQVTIDSTKSNLILRSSNPKNLAKPTIKYLDQEHVGPRDADEALDESKIDFDRNGALRILAARNVLVEGIAVDGDGVTPFGYDAVWEGRYALQHGNAAITIWVAGQCIIKDCDISNAYIGINIKDRNEGGVFANPNPADIDPDNIIPFSGFAQTGNHVIEYNRIHDNSLGFFFESTWDMGSTIRYNLIYENHHPTTAIANRVKSLTSEGGNQAGGAFMFKDQLLSPLAIYNNTLWHNSIPFLGNWKSGGQHLIFNNIISTPNEYFGSSTTTFATSFEMSKAFVNRMHNTVWAAQQQAPTASYTTITNDLRPEQTAGSYQPGALISPFPDAAEVRWLETDGDASNQRFLSTDPTSPDFLVPDWGDPEVQEFIVDGGWEVSGVKDQDGSVADLGAISMGGGRPVDLVTMRLKMPIQIEGNSATVNFEIAERIGEMSNPRIVMVGVVTNLDTSDVFGAEYTPITAANVRRVELANQTVQVGDNTITVPLPGTGTGDFAFIEMIVEGTGSNGLAYTSAVGFFPYREFNYIIEVEVLDGPGGNVITTVTAGDPVVLRVRTYNGDVLYTNTIAAGNTDVGLQSPTGALFLFDPTTGDTVKTVVGGINNGEGSFPVMFTKVPVDGVENVRVVAIMTDPANPSNKLTFMGVSDGITVLPGPPAKVAIVQPTPFGEIIEMQSSYNVLVQVYDKYDNRVGAEHAVNCESLQPDIGDISIKVDSTDANGLTVFPAFVTDGAPGDTFYVRASLPGFTDPMAADTAFLIVGEPTDKIYIFYGDTAAYDPTATIEGCSGERFPVTIRASKDGISIETDRNTAVSLNPDPDLVFFATATSTEQITSAQLVSGQVVVYIQAIAPQVTDGMIIVTSQDPSLTDGRRSGINFENCFTQVRVGAYYANNGRGAVDRAEIWYMEALTEDEIPDSIRFCWPAADVGCKTVYKIGGGITLDPADPTHLIVPITPSFAEATTRIEGASNNLATAFWTNAATGSSVNQNIQMTDSVGPLLAAAVLIERLGGGDDTMMITFTEPVDYTKLPGQTLTLLQGGQSLQLTIKDARPGTGQEIVVTVDALSAGVPAAGDSLRITVPGTVSDNSGNFPHPANRPVVIQIKSVAPSLVAATYRDGNGDGMVDTVRLTFNKAVDTEFALFTVNFDGEQGSAAVDPGLMTYVDGTKMVIDMPINQIFTTSFLKDKTSGSMLVTALFANFPEGENASSITATDNAAPVLIAVEYHFGRVDSLAYDTLYVKYSELLTDVPKDTSLCVFIDAASGLYIVPVFVPATGTDPKYPKAASGTMNGFYQFIVDSTKLGDRIVTANDSAWINTGNPTQNAIDMNGNAQLIANNKRVPVVVKIPPFLSVKYGPNPMTAGADKFKVRVEAVTKVTGSIEYDYSFQILDKVGNPVKRIPETGLQKSIEPFVEFQWDGRNTTGRYVGNGTYIGMLLVTFSSIDGTTYTHKQNIKIGVKR